VTFNAAMPLVMRPLSSEALSYLRRSLAIPLYSPKTFPCTLTTALRPQHHPQSAVLLRRPPQCRALHLYKTARSKTVLGQHKILPFQIYKPPAPSESKHKINLWTKIGGEQIAEGLTLEEVLENYISPGNMLYLTQPVKKGHSENWEYMKKNNIPQEFNNYAIVKAGDRTIHIAQHKQRNHPNPEFRDLAGLKEIHVNLASPVAYWMLVLARAYAFLDNGNQVEFSIRFKGSYVRKETRRQPGDQEVWPWMHNHFPHLRPDFILKGMPKGTYYMIHPFSDGKHVQFVLAMPHTSNKTSPLKRNFTKRALLVKSMVETSIGAGRQPQLPMIHRKKLIEAGSDMYSLDSGVAKAVVQEQLKEFHFVSPKTKDIRWGNESLELIPRSVKRAKMKENLLAKRAKKREKKEKRKGIRRFRGNTEAGADANADAEWLKPSEPSWMIGRSHTTNSERLPPSNDAQPSQPKSGQAEDTTKWTEDGQSPGRAPHSENRFMELRTKEKQKLEWAQRAEGNMQRGPRDEAGQSFGDKRRRARDTV
jgi:hypothetical protein